MRKFFNLGGASRPPRFRALLLSIILVLQLLPASAAALGIMVTTPCVITITSNKKLSLADPKAQGELWLSGIDGSQIYIEWSESGPSDDGKYVYTGQLTNTTLSIYVNNYGTDPELQKYSLKTITFSATHFDFDVDKVDHKMTEKTLANLKKLIETAVVDPVVLDIPESCGDSTSCDAYPGQNPNFTNKGTMPLTVNWQTDSEGRISIRTEGLLLSVKTITIDLDFDEKEVDPLGFTPFSLTTDPGTCGEISVSYPKNQLLGDNRQQATEYTVTASANPGYEYAGYTLTTESGTMMEVPWTDINYTYGTRESGDTSNPGDTRRSTATFDVTITENAELNFKFNPIDPTTLFDNRTVSLFKGLDTEGVYLSLTDGSPPTGSPVPSYKPGDWAYISVHAPVHGSISYTASEEPLAIKVYAGNSETESLGELLAKGSNQFCTGSYIDHSGLCVYPKNYHPSANNGLNLVIRCQLPKTDYITAVIDWPGMDNGYWEFPIQVMDTNDVSMNRLQEVYDALYKPTGYDPFRYYLNYIYEEESSKLLAADPQDRPALCERAIERVRGAAEGEGADAVVWRLKGPAQYLPDRVDLDSGAILVAVPSTSQGYVMHGHFSMIATLEAISPGHWTYEYSAGLFGAAVNRLSWGQSWDTEKKEIVHKTNAFTQYGNYGSFFNDRDGYSNVGVSNYPTFDGAIMAWNGPASIGTWNQGLLRYYFGLDDEKLEAALQERGTSWSTMSFGTEYLNELFSDVDLDRDGDPTNDFRRYGIFSKRSEAASAVIQLINAIGTVSPRSGPAIEAAEKAYDALTDAQKAEVGDYYKGILDTARKQLEAILNGSSSTTWSSALTAALTAFQGKTPVVGSTGGEWTVLAVARQLMTKPGQAEDNQEPTADVKFINQYLSALDSTLGFNGLDGLDTTGLQHTEYSRIVLALSALGVDAHPYVAADGKKYDFLPYLEDTAAVIKQGVNGPIFALLALDSKPYDDTAAKAARETYISTILSAQLGDGGWSVGGVSMDTDITAMALQALAPYYLSDLDVQKAVNLALETLSKMQSDLGGFYSSGVYNSESVSQVIVALTALAYHTGSGSLTGDTWHVCGTDFKNPVTALMSFYDDGSGMFGHTLGDTDQMATEQAAYALVAYNRYTNRQLPLYTMRDAFEAGSSTTGDDLAAVEAAQKAVYQAFNGKLEWLQPGVTEATIRANLPKLDGVNAQITINKNTALVDGTPSDPNGTDGEVAFSVTLSKGSVTLTAAFTKSFPAKKHLSDDYGLRSVAVQGKAGLFQEDKNTIRVTLEQEMVEHNKFLASDFQITPKDPAATVSTLTQQGFDWIFHIISASGTEGPEYTIEIVGSDAEQEIAEANIAAAASIVKAAGSEKLPTGIQTEAAISDWAKDLVPDAVGIERTVQTKIIAPAVDGTKDNPNGTDGKAEITVTLTTAYETGPAASTGMDMDEDVPEDTTATLLEEAAAKLEVAKKQAGQALSDFSDIPQTTDEDTLRSWAAERLNAVEWESDIRYQLTVDVNPPVDGTEDAPEGMPGKVIFTVGLACAAGEETVNDSVVVEHTLAAKPYEAPAEAPAPEEDAEPQPGVNQDGNDMSGDTDKDTGIDPDGTDGDSAVLPEDPDSVVLSAASFHYNSAPERLASVEKSVTITVTIPAKPYTPSNETGLASVVYNNQTLTAESGYNYNLELPTGETFNTAWLVITPIDSDAAVSALTAGENGLWSFTVTAANGDKANYSLLVTSVSGTKEENQGAVNTAWAKINAIDSWAVPMATVNNLESGVKTYINTSIAGLVGNVSYSIAIDAFKQAIEGSKEAPKGTDGSFTATITLSKGIPGSSTYVEENVTIEGTITAKEYETKPEGEITVWFTLLGDTAHGDPGTTNTHTLSDRNLETWIPTQEVTVSAGSTVGDVFSMVLDEWGYRYVGLEGNYIKTIITPKGLSLSEFTNGQLSGWMYTVNGEHPNQGLNKWEVFDGDEIIWHYTDDYTRERGGTGSTDSSSQLTPAAVVRNGIASAAVTEQELSAAIDAAVKERLGEILIVPTGTERADSLSVDLPAAALYEAARSGLGVTVESPTGIVSIPNSALSNIARAAGSTVTIVTTIQNSNQAENLLSDEELTDEQLTDCSVTEVTIISGRSNITSWGGSSITLSLPVDSRYFEARERYTVYQISDNGSVEEHTGRCVKSGSTLYVEVDVSHLSTFVVISAAMEINDEGEVPEDALPANIYLPFADTANHWALDSIGYVYQWGLMNGTSAYTFQPEANMSRAMFVTVLHRMEGTPASASANVYNDVAAGTWYTDAVTWATSAGIVNGTGAGKFSPNASITREEMATMMMRYAKYKGYDTAAAADLANYADSYQINEWAYRAMEWANGTGMITGRTAFTLVPQGTATRAETATILVRFIQKFAPNMY